MNAGAISKLLYGFVSVQAIIHSLNLVDNLPVQTHKQELLLVSCSYYVFSINGPFVYICPYRY